MATETIVAALASLIAVFASLIASGRFLSATSQRTRAAVSGGKSLLVPSFAILTGIIGIATFFVSDRPTRGGTSISAVARDSLKRDSAIKAQVAQRTTEAAVAIAVAQARDSASSRERIEPESIAAGVRNVVTPSVVQTASQSRILWVDDHPNNNVYEQQALRALGAQIVIDTNTTTALGSARNQQFDLVISDATRQDVANEGINLIKQLRAAGDSTPVIIYRAYSNDSTRTIARNAGAVDETSDPETLFQLAIKVLQHRSVQVQ